MKKGNAVLISSDLTDLGLFSCEQCEKNTITSSSSAFCPHCYSGLPKKQDIEASMTASVKKKLKTPVVFCESCETDLYSDTDTDAEALANSIYCPICGGGEIVACEIESGDNEGDLGVDDDSEEDENLESEEDDITDDVKDKIADMPDGGELEASLIGSPEPTWFFFRGGNPVFKLAKSKVHADLHSIFASDDFVQAFTTRIKDTDVVSTLNEFGGEVLDQNKALNTDDLETLAFEKLQSSVMPKFLDCLALAIEGSAKGVYKNLNNDLKASFHDELVAGGLTDKAAQSTIEAAFYSAGPDVFVSLVAMATQLMYKDEKTFVELKSTIQDSGTVTSNVTEDTIAHSNLKAKLIAGNINIDTNGTVKESTVSNMRERISFKTKK